MPQNIYQILSLACRYWFAFLGVLIVWRSFSWLRKDRRMTHKRLKTLPDAGLIGELVVLQGSDELPEGTSLPLPCEGTLGCLRTCDVVVPVSGVAKQHADFTFISGQGVAFFPRPGCPCMVDGQMLHGRRDARQFPMRHNSLLSLGDAVLKLRIFAGLDAPYAADFMPEDNYPMDPPDEADSFPYRPYPTPPEWPQQSQAPSPLISPSSPPFHDRRRYDHEA